MKSIADSSLKGLDMDHLLGKLVFLTLLGLFVVPTGRYEVREQYVVYDSDSFIADVGGFLGLLLGHSMLSLYQLGAQWIAGGTNVDMIRKFL